MTKMNKVWNQELPFSSTRRTSTSGWWSKIDVKTVKVGLNYNWEDIHLWAFK